MSRALCEGLCRRGRGNSGHGSSGRGRGSSFERSPRYFTFVFGLRNGLRLYVMVCSIVILRLQYSCVCSCVQLQYNFIVFV